MIRLQRLGPPAVLSEKKAQWDQAYAQKRAQHPRERPPSAKYAHPAIRAALRAISDGKCFYCEQKMTDIEGEVDHHVEVAERPDLAFEWTNLYWSCDGCNNGKPTNQDLPVTSCLDPCDPGCQPEAHLQYEKEFLLSKTEPGAATIRKYRLTRQDLELKRGRKLREFYEVLTAILLAQNQEQRQTNSARETDILRSFGSPQSEFSLMFRQYLARLDAT